MHVELYCAMWPTILGEQLWVFQRKLNSLSDDIQMAAEPTNHTVCDLWPLSSWIRMLLSCFVSETDFSGAGKTVKDVTTLCTTRGRCGDFLCLLCANRALQTDSILCWSYRRILGVVWKSIGTRGWGERRDVRWSAWCAGCRPGLSRCAWCPVSIVVIHSEQAELQREVGWRGVRYRVHHGGFFCVRAQSWRRSWSVEGDTVLPSYGLNPETAWPAKVGQGDDTSRQNDVPNWHKTDKPVGLFHQSKQGGLDSNTEHKLKFKTRTQPNRVNVQVLESEVYG